MLSRVIVFASLVVALAQAAFADAPKVGDKAPDFTLQGSDGQTYSLSQFAGKLDCRQKRCRLNP